MTKEVTNPAWSVSMIDASTTHLSESSRAWMQEHVDSNKNGGNSNLIAYGKEGYGWFLHVPGDGWIEDEGLSEYLKEVPKDIVSAIAFARLNGFQWIMFDADGCEIDELTKFMGQQE